MKTSPPERPLAVGASVISDLLPRHDFEECHQLCDVPATPAKVIAAVRVFDDREDRVLAALLWLRERPGRWLGRILPGHGIAADRPRFGLRDFTLLSVSAQHVAFGLAGAFWKVDFGLVRVPDARAFVALDEPGIAKLLLVFEVTPQAPGRCCIETLTRVMCTDAGARRRMRFYWSLIRPFSGWIRRRILRQLQRATSMPTPQQPGKA